MVPRLAFILGLALACVPIACSGAAARGGDGAPDAGAGAGGGGGGSAGGGAGGGEGDAGEGDADGASFVDEDQDGLDDTLEAKWAADYFPFLSVHPSDGCKTHGVLYRVSPHPKDATKLAVWYDVLWDRDCGASGHDGDDEMFGTLVDPKKPPPDGLLAVRAISHQGTPCEHVSTCGHCGGMSTCAVGSRRGKSFPVVFPSKDKHGQYVDKSFCDSSFVCDFGGCALAPSADASPMVNAGEPGHPLVSDLTTQGFITQANGWTSQGLFHFDPWKKGKFGGAGDVSGDLVDTAFVIDPAGCP